MPRASREELPSAATTTGALKVRPSLVVTPMIRSVRGSMIGAVTLVLLVQPGAAGDRAVGEDLVEVGARPDQAVGRELGQLGPGQLERLGASAVDPQADVAHPAGLFG